MSLPCNICCLMDDGTRGALRAMADGGIGAGAAVDREKEVGGLYDTGLEWKERDGMFTLVMGAPSETGSVVEKLAWPG